MKKALLFIGMFVWTFLASAAGLTYNVTVPAGTNACYIAGAMTNPAWTQVEMTKVDATHYTITIATATTAHKYKYCSGPDWAYEELTADDKPVADRTYAANDVVAKWKRVYDPAVVPVNVTYDVTVPATDKCFIAGNCTSWKFTEMTKLSDTHFTITLNIVPTIKDGYKYCAGPGWGYEELTAAGGAVADRTYAANDVVAKWKAIATSLTSVQLPESKVLVSGQSVKVVAQSGSVEIYSISGVKIDAASVSGEYVSKPLSAGLYVVVLDGVSTKVVIK